MRHHLYAAEERICNTRLVTSLLQHKGADHLSLELLQMFVDIFSLFVPDSNNHQLKLVDLARELCGCLTVLSPLDVRRLCRVVVLLHHIDIHVLLLLHHLNTLSQN
jgi:hypothetical protein